MSSAIDISILRTVAACARSSFERRSTARVSAVSGSSSVLGQLGNAVYQGGHYAPELLLQHAVRYVAVLHHVVQQGGGEGVGVQVQVGQEQRGLQGMLDERLPGQPLLAVVSLLGETKGVLDHLHLVCG